jgi:hypothetical protein
VEAYRQHNSSIPPCAEIIYRMLSAELTYCELHNALTDAIDELTIIKLLDYDPGISLTAFSVRTEKAVFIYATISYFSFKGKC